MILTVSGQMIGILRKKTFHSIRHVFGIPTGFHSGNPLFQSMSYMRIWQFIAMNRRIYIRDLTYIFLQVLRTRLSLIFFSFCLLFPLMPILIAKCFLSEILHWNYKKSIWGNSGRMPPKLVFFLKFYTKENFLLNHYVLFPFFYLFL